MNDYESAALWDLYGKTDEAIAIQSTLGALIESVAAYPEPVFIGAVRYIDYDREAIPEGNAFTPFLFKRRSFEHDRELRAIVVRWPQHHEGEPFDVAKFWAQETITDGVAVPIDTRRLIQRVHVSPVAPPWLLSVVQAVTTQFGLHGDVCTQSKLAEDPMF